MAKTRTSWDKSPNSKKTLKEKGLSDEEIAAHYNNLGKKGGKASAERRRSSELIVNTFLDGITAGAGKSSKLEEYTRKLIDEAIRHPNSSASRILAGAIGYDGNFTEKADKWLNLQQQKDEDFNLWRIRKLLHPGQQKVFDDDRPRVVMMCGRRWGKTEVSAAKLIKRSAMEGKPCLIVHKSLESAIGQYWTAIDDISRKAGIEAIKKDKSSGKIDFGKGFIQFHSNDNRPNIDKLRGNNYSLVVMDECFFHGGSLKYAIEDVLWPGMGQHADRQLILSSTPPVSKVKFYEGLLDTLPVYSGTVLDNPFIPAAHDEFRRLMAERGDTISFRREWLGERVFDEEAIVYHPQALDIKPTGITAAYCGLDLGVVDSTALVCIAVNNHLRKAWIIQERMWNEEGSAESVRIIKEEYDKFVKWLAEHGLKGYSPYIHADHNEKMTTYDLSNLQGLPVEAAYKTDTLMSISHLQDALKLGTLIIPKDGIVWDECDSTVWKRSKETDNLLPEFDDSVFHPNALDAVRYAWNRIVFDDPGMM